MYLQACYRKFTANASLKGMLSLFIWREEYYKHSYCVCVQLVASNQILVKTLTTPALDYTISSYKFPTIYALVNIGGWSIIIVLVVCKPTPDLRQC